VYKVGYFVGSLSSTSVNRELSRALNHLAPEDLEFHEIPLRNLPLYSPDYDGNYPPEANALKDAIHRADAVLFVTPEYNRSMEIFPGDGQVKDETMKAFLAGYMAEFRDHIVRVLTVLPRTAKATQTQ